jgi:hypothetical protein
MTGVREVLCGLANDEGDDTKQWPAWESALAEAGFAGDASTLGPCPRDIVAEIHLTSLLNARSSWRALICDSFLDRLETLDLSSSETKERFDLAIHAVETLLGLINTRPARARLCSKR